MYVCMHMGAFIDIYFVDMYVCMYVCIYVYIYIYGDFRPHIPPV